MEAPKNFNILQQNNSDYTLIHLWHQVKKPQLLFLVVFVSCSSAFLLGYNLSVFNTTLPIIISELGWCKPDSLTYYPNAQLPPFNATLSQDYFHTTLVHMHWGCREAIPKQSLLQGCVMLGAAFGSVWSGSLLNHLGRRRCLLILNFGFILGFTVSALSTSLLQLSLGRTMTGIMSGLATVVPSVYLDELTPPFLRSFWSFFPSISVNFGILVGIIAGTPLIFPDSSLQPQALSMVDWNFDRLWWRGMLFLPVFLCISTTYILFTYCTFETPTFLRCKGGSAAADELESLIWPPHSERRGCTRPTEPYDTLEEMRGTDPTGEGGMTEKDSGEMMENVQRDPTWTPPNKVIKLSILGALSRQSAFREQLAVGWILAILQQLTGINVFTSKSSSLFLEAGLPFPYVTLASACMATLGLLFSCVIALLMNSLSRRKVFLWAMIGMTLSLFPSAVSEYIFGLDSNMNAVIFMVSTFLFTSIFACSYGPAIFFYLNELWPEEIKEEALSIAFGLNWLCSFCIIGVSESLSQRQSMKLFSIFCFLGCIFVYFCIKETQKTAYYHFLGFKPIGSKSFKYVTPETELAVVA